MKLPVTKKPLLKLLVLLSLLGTAVACGIKKDSPAPGCVEYWGLAPMGGCFGKSVILDLQVEPALDCLTIEVNNCNGGVLTVDNLCSESLVLGGVEISPGERSVSLDIVGQEGDTYLLTRVASNFAKYVPAADELIVVLGTLGDQEVKVSFTKTKELC